MTTGLILHHNGQQAVPTVFTVSLVPDYKVTVSVNHNCDRVNVRWAVMLQTQHTHIPVNNRWDITQQLSLPHHHKEEEIHTCTHTHTHMHTHKKQNRCNRVYCIHVPGHDPITFSFRSFSFLIGWGFYGPSYLRCQKLCAGPAASLFP